MSTGFCVVLKSDVSSGSSNFSAGYITQTLNGDGNTAINYNIAASTTASGSGGGSGGGGGGTCFTPDSKLLDTRIFSSIKVGDLVWIERPDGTRLLRPVREVLTHEYTGKVHHVSNDTWATPNHMFRVSGSWFRADELFPITKEYSGIVLNLHIDTEDDDERNYVLEDGSIAHNNKIV